MALVLPYPDSDWETIQPLAAWSEAPPTDPSRPTGPEIASATSDAQGRFQMTVPPGQGRGPFRLSARVDSVGSASANDVFAGKDVELTLASGGLVEGTVTARATGSGVGAAKIVFDSGEREYSVQSGEDGSFRIEGMPPGRYSVRVGAPGRTPLLGIPVKVERGVPVKLELPVGTTLRIRTVDGGTDAATDESPAIGGVTVVAMEDDSHVYVIGKTNDYGQLELTGLPAGSWTLNGRKEKWVSMGAVPTTFDENKPFVDETIEFEAAVPTPVEVVDERGSPVAGVEFYSGDGNDEYDVLRSEKLPGTTDSSGKWTFAFEFDGPRCSVFAFKQGYGAGYLYPDDYQSGEAQKIVLHRAVRVHGRVSDANGVAVPDAIVRLTFDVPMPAGTPPRHAAAPESFTLVVRTGAAGTYDMPFVPVGYEVSIDAEFGETFSDDLPTVDTSDGQSEYQVDLQLTDAGEPTVTTGQNPTAPPKAPVVPPHPPVPPQKDR